MSNEFDVIIAGGGPAGSSCATVLARAGLKVLVLDKANFPREKICGDCINPKCWELFELLGVAHTLRSMNPQTIDSVRVTNAGGTSIVAAIPMNAKRPFFSIKRSQLDNVLVRNARASGACVQEDTQVIEIRRQHRWEVVARRSNGAGEDKFSAKYLVGADGRNSIVASTLGQTKLNGSPRFLREERRTSRHGERVGIQWNTKYQPHIGASVEMFLFPSGYGGIVNIDSTYANVAMVTYVKTAQLAKHDVPQMLRETILSNPGAQGRFESLHPIGEISAAFPITPARRSLQHPNAFLVGDAHQTVEPFTGEGVYFAMQDGASAATRILQKLHNHHALISDSRRNRFWLNHIYSPVLRSNWISHWLVELGAHSPAIIPYVLRPIFPA